MAITTIVFWGVVLDQDFQAPWDHAPWEGDAEAYLADRMGVKKPTDVYVDAPDTKVAYQKYWEERKTVISDAGCIVGTHYNDKNARYYAAIVESESMSYGDPIAIGGLIAESEWEDRLNTFCKICGIPPGQGQWWSVCYWGYPKDNQVADAGPKTGAQEDDEV